MSFCFCLLFGSLQAKRLFNLGPLGSQKTISARTWYQRRYATSKYDYEDYNIAALHQALNLKNNSNNHFNKMSIKVQLFLFLVEAALYPCLVFKVHLHCRYLEPCH